MRRLDCILTRGPVTCGTHVQGPPFSHERGRCDCDWRGTACWWQEQAFAQTAMAIRAVRSHQSRYNSGRSTLSWVESLWQRHVHRMHLLVPSMRWTYTIYRKAEGTMIWINIHHSRLNPRHNFCLVGCLSPVENPPRVRSSNIACQKVQFCDFGDG